MRKSLLNSSRLTVLLGICLLIAGAFVVVEVRSVLGQQDAHLDTTTALLSSNRERLQICTESLTSVVSDQRAREVLDRSLAAVQSHPEFDDAGLAKALPRVDTGCPSDAAITNLQPGREINRNGIPNSVDDPSGYRVHVYVISNAQLGSGFADPAVYPRTVPHEVLCKGHTCAEVTTALYLSDDELSDLDLVQRSLSHAIGLRPVDEPLPDDSDLPIDPRGK